MSISSIIDVGFKAFSDTIGRLKVPKGTAEILKEYARAYGDEIFPNQKTLEDLTYESVKDSVRKGYSIQRQSELSSTLSSVLKDAEAQKLNLDHNAFEFFNMRIKTASGALEEEHKAFVGGLETELLKKGGKEVLNVYQLAFQNPKRLKREFDISNEDVFIALADPTKAKNPILSTIGGVYREMDKAFTNRIKNISLMGELDDYVVPLKPNPNVVESLGREGFAQVLHKYTKMSAKTAKDISEDYFDQLSKKGPDKVKIQFKKRDLVFDEGEKGLKDQYEFYRIVSGLNDDNSGVMERVIYHKEKALQKAYFFKEFGSSPEETINKLYQGLKKGAGEDKLKRLTNYQRKNLRTLEFAVGRGYAEYGPARYWVDAVDKFTSAIYGAPASLLRNLAIDYTAHGASIQKAFLDNTSVPGYYSERFFKPLRYLFTSVLDKGKREALGEMLDMFGFAKSNNALFQTQGLRRENFFGDVIDLTGSKTMNEKIGRVFNDFAGKANYFIQGISGNIAHYDATTAVNILNSATAFSTMILKNVRYKDFLESLGPKGVRTLDWHFGIGEKEFLALKDSYKILAQTLPASKVRTVLGYGDQKMILPTTLKEMPDEIASKYKKKTETAAQFKERLRIAYHSLLTHQRNISQTGLYRGNRIIDQSLARGTFVDLILRPFAKFFNITHAQHYDGLRVGMSMALYGSPYNTNYGATLLKKKGLPYWGKALAFYSSGAYITLASKDVLSGREPRALTGKQAGLVLASSGVGGIPFSLFTQSFYSGAKTGSNYYGDSPLGSLTSDIIKLYDAAVDKDPYKFAKFVQNTSGVGKLWWAKGINDKLIRESFLDDGERLALEKWYAEELKSPFY